jgi:hypothetical protein
MRIDYTMAALLLLLGIGLWGGLSVSYTNFTGQQACPQVAGLAICYIVTLAYGLMLVSLFLKRKSLHRIVFFPAWGVTFLIALSGSGLELSQGGVCPATSFHLPLCYVSLAMCLAIMAFYWLNRRNSSASRSPDYEA